MSNRFIVRSSFDKKNRATVFFVRDNSRSPQRIAGINTPFNSKEEAEYVAWVLNINPRYQNVSGRTSFKRDA